MATLSFSCSLNVGSGVGEVECPDFQERELWLKPRRPEIWRWTSKGVLKKMIWDFSLLQSSPEASEKV
jgi:hypothetical protein